MDELKVEPRPEDGEAIGQLHREVDAIFQGGRAPCLVTPDGDRLELPHNVFEALRAVVSGMAAGRTMLLCPTERLLTTQQAAEFLQVSRPHLVKLLNDGKLSYEQVGTHRRLAFGEVMRYRAERRTLRRGALRELSELAAEDPNGYQ